MNGKVTYPRPNDPYPCPICKRWIVRNNFSRHMTQFHKIANPKVHFHGSDHIEVPSEKWVPSCSITEPADPYSKGRTSCQCKTSRCTLRCRGIYRWGYCNKDPKRCCMCNEPKNFLSEHDIENPG